MTNPIDELLRVLETADRFGAEHDEPEGSRCIILTDTLARNLVAAVREWRAREWSDEELLAEYVQGHEVARAAMMPQVVGLSRALTSAEVGGGSSPPIISGLRAVARAVRDRA